jgi:hypothetical protein
MTQFLIKLTRIVFLLGTVSAFAYPVKDSNHDFGTLSDKASQILRDSVDKNVYYIPPTKVILAENPLTRRKLFRLSYSSEGLDGELFAVFKLGFDLNQVAAEWEQILAKNPEAFLKSLPIYGGVFGLEFETSEFKLLIGKADVLETDIAAGLMPVHLKINATGLRFLRAHSQISAKQLLTLTFEYKTKYIFTDEQNRLFSVNPRRLLSDFLGNALIQAAWEHSDLLNKQTLRNYLLSVFAPPKQLWLMSQPVEADELNLKGAAYLFYQALEAYLKSIVGESFELRSKAQMQRLSLTDLPEESMTLRGLIPGEPKEVTDSATMVLRGVCEEYADAVFIEETGESNCLAFPFGEASDGDEGFWVPDF